VTLREAAIVLGLPVAVFLASMVLAHRAIPSAGVPASGAPLFTDGRLLRTLATEAILTAALLPWLLRRGWRPLASADAPEPRDVLRGAGLWLGAIAVTYVGHLALFVTDRQVSAALVSTVPWTGAVSPAVIVAVAVLNPVFEEFLWLGYGVGELQRRLGLRGAMIVSVALRTAVHAYQGVYALLGVLPLGLVFTWYYGRTRRLWPVVVAHVIVDGMALAVMVARGRHGN
jgi:membrane protease YdiL (CAAX protease family)